MNNLVDFYLAFKARTVSDIVELLVAKRYPDFKLTSSLQDVVYDFINETCLSADYLTRNALKDITGVKLDQDSNSLLRIFVEYGAVTRAELKSNAQVFEIYKFIVDATIFYTCICGRANTRLEGYVNFDDLEREVLRDVYLNDSQSLRKAIKKNEEDIRAILMEDLKANDDFNNQLFDPSFKIDYKAVGDNLYIGEVVYNNADLDKYEAHEIEHVKKAYDIDLFLAGTELISLDMIERNLARQGIKILYRVPEFVLDKKTYLNNFLDTTGIFCVSSNLIPTINYSYTVKNDDIVDQFANAEYEVGIYKDSKLPSNFNLYEAKYLLLEFEGETEEFKNVVKRAQTTSDIVIVNEIPKRDALVLLKDGIKYFVKGR